MLKDTGILAQLVERFIYTEDAGSSNLSCPMGVLVNQPFIVPSDGVGWGPWWCGVQGVTKGFQRDSKGIPKEFNGLYWETSMSNNSQQTNQLTRPLTHSLTSGWTSLVNCFEPGQLTVSVHNHGEVTRRVSKDSFRDLMQILRDQSHFQFKVLTDMTAVDYPSRDPRFDVVYHRLSVHYQTRCRVKRMVDERSRVPSVTSIFQSANWAERECFDMFGICFDGHPDLRRLLTDYGFEGHPRRKDFPLTGFTEVRYDEASKRVVSEPVERSQDYRPFDFRMPWKAVPDTPVVKG